MAKNTEFKMQKVAKATYSFAVDGGVAEAISLADSSIVPSGAIITDVKTDVRTIVTSGGAATIAITAGGVTLKAAETIALSEMDATGIVDVIRAGNAGATGTAKYIPIKATSDAKIGITVATAALTAGIADFYVTYYI